MKQPQWIPLAVTALLLAGSAAARGPDPVQVKLDDIDTRLGRVEAVVNNQSLLDLSRRIDALETQMRHVLHRAAPEFLLAEAAQLFAAAARFAGQVKSSPQ